MSIYEWKLRNNHGTILAQVKTFVSARESVKMVNRLYDGSYNVQTIGLSQKYADVEVLAESRENMDRINYAEVSGNLLTIDYRGTKYTGWIKETIKWTAELKGEVYTGSFKFLIYSEGLS